MRLILITLFFVFLSIVAVTVTGSPYTRGTLIGSAGLCLCNDLALMGGYDVCSVIQLNGTANPMSVGSYVATYLCISGVYYTVVVGGDCSSCSPSPSTFCSTYNPFIGNGIGSLEGWVNMGYLSGLQFTDNVGLSSTVCGSTSGSGSTDSAPTTGHTLGFLNWQYSSGKVVGVEAYWVS